MSRGGFKAFCVDVNGVVGGGSTQTGITDGILIKGWLNPNYIRSANVDVLPASCSRHTYSGGRWLCTSAGTLVCWDQNNRTPFEAAT